MPDFECRSHGAALRLASALLAALLLAGAAQAAGPLRVTGIVKDPSGAAIPGAQVRLEEGQRIVVAATTTDSEGRFAIEGLRPATYLLVVGSHGFTERRIPLRLAPPGIENLEITLGLGPVSAAVSVTANLSRIEEADSVSQPVNVLEPDALRERARTHVAQAAEEEVGVHLQRTSPTIGGVFVRGLTGNKVNVFVDGVRYSTGAQRGGISTFLGLIQAENLQGLEILRGPNSVQYGSDALGGSLQFISRNPVYSGGGLALRGTYGVHFDSAAASYDSHLSLSVAGKSAGLLTNFTGLRSNRLRPGQGLDSHSAFTRFFGLSSKLFLGSRMPDTAFTQYGGMVRANWSPAAGSQLIAHYSRSQQDGGRRFDQLLGGDGNLVADLRNLMLDFFYVRYDQQRLGWFDDAVLTYSFNSQREERVNQGGNGNPLASINHEYERTRVHGVQAMGSKRVAARHNLLFGAEYYHERIRAPSFGFDPSTQATALRRGRVPDRARYRNGGIFAQDVFEALPDRLRLVGSLRYGAASYRSRAADSPLVAGQPLWPDDSLRTSSFTFRAGAVLIAAPGLNLSANVSRGFRAPHITDLGTLGLTGDGFEVAALDVAGLGATVGSTADAAAFSTGIPVRQLEPETSLSYEFGVHYRHSNFRTEFAFFVNDIDDNIAKQALILPPGAVGQTLGSATIAAQNANGVVFVDVTSSPVLVRANFDRVRILGVEHTATWQITPQWSAGTVFTFVRARDRVTGRPPNVEGGTPAPDGYLKIRYTARAGRWWVEPYLHAAARQGRLSSLDLADRRTGATRSVTSITDFFRRGATARGLVGAGADAMPGTADDILLATGETLPQILNRVLGPGMTSAPLYTAVPGYFTASVRGGVQISERQDLLLDFFNIGDRNYRGISWGLDAPGRSFAFRYLIRF
jgi:hemoglobin/transferrin/lactoferrin receptor protein